MAKTVKTIAIVGAGYMGQEYAKSISMTAGLKLVGICSRSKEKAITVANRFSIPIVADSVQQLYQETLADAVIIAVPELSAKDVIFEALNFPWVAVLEKPPGYLPLITKEIFDQAQKMSRTVFVTLNRRFYGSTTCALEMLNDSKSTRSLIIQDQEDQNAAVEAGQPRDVAAAWMYANSIHLIDYAFLMCRGDCIEVRSIQPFTPFQPCVVQSLLRFSSGDSATYIGLWQRPGPWGVQLSTDELRLEMRPLEQLSYQMRGQRQVTTLPTINDDLICKPGLLGLSRELLKALNGQPHGLPTLEDGLKLMHCIEKIFFP